MITSHPCMPLEISADSSWDTPCKTMLLLRLGTHLVALDRACHAVNAVHSRSMHPALSSGYKEYSPHLCR